MKPSNAVGQAAAKRRRERAEQHALNLEEILSDAVNTQTRALERGFTEGAGAQAQAALVAAGGEDLPAPQFNWRQLWDDALWVAALDEAELFVADFVVDELDVEFGIQVTSRQPFVQGLAAESVAGIEAWTDEMRKLVGDVVDRGHRETLSVREVAANLQDAGVRTKRQATLIARTEMIASSNGASFKGATSIAEPGDRKQWLDSNDKRVRPDHENVDDVPFDQPFMVGGEQGDYPGSSQFSPAQRSNCRCSWRLIAS